MKLAEPSTLPLLFLARFKGLAHIVVVVIAEMHKQLMSQVHYFGQTVSVLSAFHLERKRQSTTPIGTGDLAPLAVHSPVLRQVLVVARLQKAFDVLLDYGLRRNIRQKIFEGHASLADVHNQLHPPGSQP